MVATIQTQAIPSLVEAVRAVAPPTGRVLSAYVDTSPAASAGPAYLLSFRDRCKAVRLALAEDERERFDAAASQVEQYLSAEAIAGRPGLAIFASGRPDYFHVVALPRTPTERVDWREQPLLAPLDEILDDFERIATVLFDKERARLLTIYLGEIEHEQTIVDDVPGRQATGGWFALAQTRYARHREDHLLRHAKRTVRALMDLLRTRPFDRLLIGGPDEALAALRHHLPRPLRARLAGTVSVELFASDAEVLRAALRVAALVEGQADLVAVRELIDAKRPASAVLGLISTLAALNAGRVHVLFIAHSGLAEVGYECSVCGHVAVVAGACPDCGSPTRASADFPEHVVADALAQGARVIRVSGEAASVLARYGGIGAWTRY